jgi:hypothetical protein
MTDQFTCRRSSYSERPSVVEADIIIGKGGAIGKSENARSDDDSQKMLLIRRPLA